MMDGTTIREATQEWVGSFDAIPTENGGYVIKESRKAELYDALLGYLSEMISSPEELVDVLRAIGFKDEEIEYEGLSVMDY